MNSSTLTCRLCGDAAARLVGTKTLLGRHRVSYYQCPRCDLIQTQTPYWLAEAYTETIARADVGAMQRTLECATLVEGLNSLLPGGWGRALDFGGGPGTLTRLLRDRGLHFHWHDKHTSNVYARGFEGSLEDCYESLTAFEVWEHLVDVGATLTEFFERQPRTVFVGTVLHQGFRPDWWYLAPSTGQHVAFFSERTLRYVAARFGYLAVITPAYTLFVRDDVKLKVSPRLLRALISRPRWMRAWVALHAFLRPRPSLTLADAARVSG